jgi:hypothetical protein
VFTYTHLYLILYSPSPIFNSSLLAICMVQLLGHISGSFFHQQLIVSILGKVINFKNS